MIDKLNEFKKFYTHTDTQVRWWAYAGWSIPIIALASIFFVYIIGPTDIFHTMIITGAILFFSIAVFWWWWAIFKLAGIAKLMLNTASNLRDIGNELRRINEELHQNDK